LVTDIAHSAPGAPLWVVCLCAQWCRVCEEYQGRFEQVRLSVLQDHPQSRFVWVDVEDEADLLDPLDIENFPTLLLAVGDSPRFFGVITPQAQTLERLVRSTAADPTGTVLADPDTVALLTKIRGLGQAST